MARSPSTATGHGYNLIGDPRGLVAASQNRVVQIGRVRLPCVKSDNDSRVFWVDRDITNTFEFQQGLAQVAHARFAIFARGRDLDGF